MRRFWLTLTSRSRLPCLFCNVTVPVWFGSREHLIKMLFLVTTWLPTLKFKNPRGQLRLVTVVRLLATGVQQNLTKRERGKELVPNTHPSLEKKIPEPQSPIQHLCWHEAVKPSAGTHCPNNLSHFPGWGGTPQRDCGPDARHLAGCKGKRGAEVLVSIGTVLNLLWCDSDTALPRTLNRVAALSLPQAPPPITSLHMCGAEHQTWTPASYQGSLSPHVRSRSLLGLTCCPQHVLSRRRWSIR